MSDIIIHSTQDSFEADVLQSDKPVLVDYWAPWCGPCKAIAPILEQLAGERQADLKIVKIDVDQNPDIATKFGIRGIPTLMLFKDGKSIATKVGAVNKPELTKFIDSSI